jgi:hypothetical protein
MTSSLEHKMASIFYCVRTTNLNFILMRFRTVKYINSPRQPNFIALEKQKNWDDECKW